MTDKQLDSVLFLIEHSFEFYSDELLTEFNNLREMLPQQRNDYVNFVKAKTQEIITKFNNEYTTKLSCGEAKISDDGATVLLTIYGGLNGPGQFSKYLETIKNVISAMESAFQYVWVIDLANDIADDVFNLNLSIASYYNVEIEKKYK